MKLRRNKKGFTIIELVIVIAVIGILAAVLIPTFVNLTSKANEASDNALVNNLNKALKMEEQEPGHQKAPTLEGAIKDLEDQGYILENISSKSGKDLLWSQSENQFLLNTEGKSGKDYWKIVDAVPAQADQKYSYYAGKNFNQTDVTVKYGFDAGRIDNIGKVTYAGTGTAQEVAIRTNNEATTLTINGYVNPSNPKDGDVIAHYGVAGALSVIKCAVGSYHENGKVGFAEINTGRIVLEQESEIEHIHINKKDANSFDKVEIKDNGTEKLPSSITRDEVSVAPESSVDVVKVIASTGAEEMVKAYGSTATGSTQKTETQNTDVNSALGGLVLDNGASSDKALDNNAKADVKEDIAGEAAAAELVDDEHANKIACIRDSSGELTYYDSFDDAFSACDNGDTMLLLQDVNIVINANTTKSPYWPYDTEKGFVINGCGHTVTASKSIANKVILFGFGGNNNTLKNTTFNFEGMLYGMVFYGNNATIKNCVFNSDNPCISSYYTTNIVSVYDSEFTFTFGLETRTDYDPQSHNAVTTQYGGIVELHDSVVKSNVGALGVWPSGGRITLNNCSVKADRYIAHSWIGNGASSTKSDSIISLNNCEIVSSAENKYIAAHNGTAETAGYKAYVYLDGEQVAYAE